MLRRAFTLVEILVVLGILTLLAAIIFPVFNAVRRRSYQVTCASNLKQLGLAVALYTQDNDGLFPRGGDPLDLHSDYWHDAAEGVYEWQMEQLPPLTYILRPYIKNSKLWACPADRGFDFEEISLEELDARPTMFDKFNMSYFYRSDLVLQTRRDLVGWDKQTNPPTEHGPGDVNVLADGHGNWHGQNEPWSARRYNVLMGDGRVVNINRKRYLDAWRLRLDIPVSTTP